MMQSPAASSYLCARLTWVLLALMLSLTPPSAQAQLTLRLPIDFSVFEPGDAFQTTPFPVAQDDFCDVTGDQPAGPVPVQCGEVDTPAPLQVGSAYFASVTAGALSRGGYSFAWSPYVACVRTTPGGSGEVISGGASSFCSQSITTTQEGMFWDLGGQVAIPAAAPPGRYTAQVTLSVSGPGLNGSISVAVALDVQAPPLVCTVSADGNDIDFGEGAAMQAGTVSLSATSGARTYGGGQFDPSGSSPFSLSAAQVTTNAATVVATVTAPSSLSGGGGSITYLNELAYRDTATGSYVPGVTGSGAVSRAAGADGFVGFRLGGLVTTTSTSASGTYGGTVSVTYSCN